MAESKLAPQFQSLDYGVDYVDSINANQCVEIDYVDYANAVNRVLLEYAHSVHHCDVVELKQHQLIDCL